MRDIKSPNSPYVSSHFSSSSSQTTLYKYLQIRGDLNLVTKDTRLTKGVMTTIMKIKVTSLIFVISWLEQQTFKFPWSKTFFSPVAKNNHHNNCRCTVHALGIQSVVPGSAASASPRSLTEMQHPGPHSRPAEWEPEFYKISGDS